MRGYLGNVWAYLRVIIGVGVMDVIYLTVIDVLPYPYDHLL